MTLFAQKRKGRRMFSLLDYRGIVSQEKENVKPFFIFVCGISCIFLSVMVK